MKYCNKCGTSSKEEFMFCGKCGFDFNTVNNNETEITDNINLFSEKNEELETYHTVVKEELDSDEIKPKNTKIAGLLQMFFGTLGLGHFYLGNNLRAVIQLVITIVSLYCILIYHASDAYTISMPATDGFPGITTSTVSLYDGAMVFGVVTFSIHFICSFFRGFDFFKSDAIEKNLVLKHIYL